MVLDIEQGNSKWLSQDNAIDHARSFPYPRRFLITCGFEVTNLSTIRCATSPQLLGRQPVVV